MIPRAHAGSPVMCCQRRRSSKSTLEAERDRPQSNRRAQPQWPREDGGHNDSGRTSAV